MDKATRQMLNESEQAIIRLVESKRLASLDEDELIQLHTRTRRARNKYRTLQRRRGAKKVSAHGSRAVATKATARTLRKAELFEGALAVVSARLAKVAAQSARALEAERLAAARATKAGKASAAKGSRAKRAKGKKASPAKKQLKTPASKRQRASTKARTKRKQAKRDNR